MRMERNRVKSSSFMAVAVIIGISILLTGCGGQKDAGTEQPSGVSDQNAAPLAQEGQDAGGIPEDVLDIVGQEVLDRVMQTGKLTREGWPEGKVPSEIPEYKNGKVVNSGGDSREYTILVDKTNRGDLDEYLDLLESSGWYVQRDDSYPTASNKNIRLDFQFNSKTLLQVSVLVEELGNWPAGQLPEDIFPPQKGMLVGTVDIVDNGYNGSEVYNITYEYSGLTDEDVEEYMNELMDSGWEGDRYMVKKMVNWKGKEFKTNIEPMNYKGNIVFSCNLIGGE
jgi:uncharacterized protein (DUF433 family)